MSHFKNAVYFGAGSLTPHIGRKRLCGPPQTLARRCTGLFLGGCDPSKSQIPQIVIREGNHE